MRATADDDQPADENIGTTLNKHITPHLADDAVPAMVR